ncbi:MAG: LamG-like jellyroll fold domain-containing protein, partial [Campylobacterota bacterium]|nr:LamG-like jellyroll fold domain-containing protein [Campylobacterota bacterium]
MKRILVSTVVLSGLFISNGFSNNDINLTNGLVAHYEFEDNTNDSSINNNNGISYGGINYVDGVIGQAVSLDGVDDYIKITNSSSLNPSKITISTWVKVNKSFSGLGTNPIVQKPYISHNPPFYQWHLGIGGDLYSSNNNSFRYSNALSGISFIDKSTNLEPINKIVVNEIEMDVLNKWKFMAITFDGKLLKRYLDNYILDITEYENEIDINSFNTDVFIARYGNLDNENSYIPVTIDDLRIYNRALNELEIEELYKLADLNNTICIQQIIYAQNPNTKTWIPFPTLCDVPTNWETNLTQPSDFNRTTLGLPP